MSMSKKDYEVIASILRANYNGPKGDVGVHRTMDRLVDSMMDAFKRDNVRFQKDRFLDAATPNWHREARGLPPMKRTVGRVHAQRPMPEGF